MQNDYKEIGMSLFSKFVEKVPEFEINRLAVEEIVSRIAEQHILQVKQYGYTVSLDSVFLNEIAKYYNAIMGIDTMKAFELLYPLINQDKPIDTLLLKNKAIVYPTFFHKKEKNGLINHIPTISAIVLFGDSYALLQDDERDKKIDNMQELQESITAITNEVSSYYAIRLDAEPSDKKFIIKIVHNKFFNLGNGQKYAVYEDEIESMLKNRML